LQASSLLGIPVPREVVVLEDGEGVVSTVSNDALQSTFREVRDMMLANGLDLEKVYRDQDHVFFIERGFKTGIGISGRIGEDSGKWE